MSGRKRIIVLAIAALFAFAVGSSFVFIVNAAGHDCCGEDCPVCAALAAVCSVLKSVCAFAALTVAALVSVCAAACAIRACSRFSACSPTALKVKLLN